jgi:hypothetical protein
LAHQKNLNLKKLKLEIMSYVKLEDRNLFKAEFGYCLDIIKKKIQTKNSVANYHNN